MYRLIRPLLFRFDAETTHHFTLNSIKQLHRAGLLARLYPPQPGKPITLMGLPLPNAVGLAAGLDKNGEYVDALAALGFGFIEVGTVTPRPQPGNPRPRLYRVPEHSAVINRMGFNNHGIDELICNIRHSRYKGVLGINIGKNAATPRKMVGNTRVMVASWRNSSYR